MASSWPQLLSEKTKATESKTPIKFTYIDVWVYTLTTTHHLSACVPVPLSPHGAVSPQELLGVVDGLGDHVPVSQETCKRKTQQDEEEVTQKNKGTDKDVDEEEEKKVWQRKVKVSAFIGNPTLETDIISAVTCRQWLASHCAGTNDTKIKNTGSLNVFLRKRHIRLSIEIKYAVQV